MMLRFGEKDLDANLEIVLSKGKNCSYFSNFIQNIPVKLVREIQKNPYKDIAFTHGADKYEYSCFCGGNRYAILSKSSPFEQSKEGIKVFLNSKEQIAKLHPCAYLTIASYYYSKKTFFGKNTKRAEFRLRKRDKDVYFLQTIRIKEKEKVGIRNL